MVQLGRLLADDSPVLGDPSVVDPPQVVDEDRYVPEQAFALGDDESLPTGPNGTVGRVAPAYSG